MLRKDRLEFCTQCKKRAFHRDKGVVCGLTNEHATFNLSCDDYDPDHELIRKTKERNKVLEEKSLKRETYGLSQFGLKNLIIVGIIVMGLSLTVIVFMLVKFNLISLYPLIFFVLGIITTIKGVKQQNERKKDKPDVLDDFI